MAAQMRHPRALGLLLLTAEHPAMAFECFGEYMERIHDLVTVSGAQTTLLWKQESEVWGSSKWFNPGLGELLTAGVRGDTDVLTQRLVAFAQEQFVACATIGGNYWHIRLFLNRYIGSLWKNGSALAPLMIKACRYHLDPSSQGHLGKEGLFVGGVCAPAQCNQDEVEQEVVPQYVGHLLLAGRGIVDKVPRFPPPGFGQVSASQLVGWDHFKLDFVIAGVDRCGTTSLRMNLQQHPQIQLSNYGREDIALVADSFQNRLLPIKSGVDKFNRQWQCPSTEDGRVLYGLAAPSLFKHVQSYYALSMIPSMRVIVVVCDPVSRFENYFVRLRYCRGDSHQSPLMRDASANQPDCLESIGQVLERSNERVFDAWSMGRRLHQLHSAFGQSMFLLHQDFMRFKPEQTFSGLVQVLGVSRPFPEGTHFRRWNVRKGHRTDLCRNRSMLRALKRRLSPEYEALEKLFLASHHKVPVALIRRETRCDRPEELIERSSLEARGMEIQARHVNWYDEQNVLRSHRRLSSASPASNLDVRGFD